MGPNDFLRVVRRRWRTVIAIAVLAVVGVGTASWLATPTYQATASLYFSLPYGATASDLSQGSTYTQAQMQSYADLATQPIVLQPVVDELDIDQSPRALAGRITATTGPDTVILAIAATDVSPARAAEIANAVADQVSATARELAPRDTENRPTVDVSTVGEARPPMSPAAPQKTRNVAAALIGGLVLGFGVAYLKERLDTRMRNADDLSRVSGAPLLGTVASDKALAQKHLVVRDLPRSPGAEAFRTLRSNVGFLDVDHRPISAVITSSLSGEGKSTTAVNLALACAEAEQRVLLVDADLRRPAIADYLGLEGAAGLTTVLSGRASFEEVVQPLGLDSTLDVLAAGLLPPNPSELLGSVRMHELLDAVRQHYDLIIFDAPPLLPVTDAAVLAQMTTGAIVVASAAKVRRHQLAQSLALLERVGADLLGFVQTRVAPTESHSYYGYSVRENAAVKAAEAPRIDTLPELPPTSNLVVGWSDVGQPATKTRRR